MEGILRLGAQAQGVVGKRPMIISPPCSTMPFLLSLPTIICLDPPETVFSGVFLGITVSSRPVLTGQNQPGGMFDTYTPKIVA